MDNIFLHDLYLRDVNLGRVNRTKVGDLYLDKPWTSKFVERKEANFDNAETLYNNFKKIALKAAKSIAVYLPEKELKYTNEELLKLIDQTSSALNEKYNINMDSVIGLCLNSSIEDPIFFLAISKLGARSKWIDYFKSPKEVEYSINNSHVSLLVMDEKLLDLEKKVNRSDIPVIVANTDKEYMDSKYLSFKQLLKIKTKSDVAAVNYVEGKKTVTINSSGTTGTSKPINHTDYSINAAAKKVICTDYPIGKDNLILKMVPSQIGLGLITSMYVGLVSGTPIILISGKSIDEMRSSMITFIKDFSKFKEKNSIKQDGRLLILTAPIHVRFLMDCEEIADLSFANIMAGGSKISKEELKDLYEKGRKKGYKLPICNAYGQNEFAGGVAYNFFSYNRDGSAGFPAIGTDIKIVDQISLESLKPNQEGLILVRSDSEFIDYDEMPDITKAAKLRLPDGSLWFNSNDLGYMDKDGFIFITGRISRFVIRSDSKISLDEVERKIRNISQVKDCGVVLTRTGGSMEEFVAFVEMQDIDSNLLSIINNTGTLNQFEIPTKFIYVENIPYLNSGKIDYEKLKTLYL